MTAITHPNSKTPKSDRQKFCHECGTVIVRHADVCSHCGSAQSITYVVNDTTYKTAQPDVTSKPTHSRIVTAILAIWLGSIGAHRFYLGQWKLGLLYAIFSWTLIPG